MHIIKSSIKLLFFFILSISIFIVCLYLYAYFKPKTIIKNANTYYIYDINNNIVNNGSSARKWITLDEVSEDYINALLSVEDKNFYKHNGFDYPRIIKAIYHNILNKKIIEGASTISQQYIKNLYQNFDKTWSRKWNEMILTLNLEVHYSKKEILEGYINTINFGQGNIGIYNASKYYFNKDPINLSTEEAIILAGIPKSPGNYNPVSNYENSINRAKVVLNCMVNNNKISKKESKSLFKNKINIFSGDEVQKLNTIMYYQDAVMDELNKVVNIPEKLIQQKGIKIYTNFDPIAQENLEKSIYNYMNNETMQVASIIINPKTGGITALTGGLDYSKSQFNRVLKAKRQVGSTMKTFVYYTALENNLTSASLFLDEETTFKLDNGRSYSPKNYGDKYANKDITMSAAIALSDNIYAIKTYLFLGGDKVINNVHKSGIKENLIDIPSFPLGTNELKMIDFAQGYTTLANEGKYIPLHLINRVEDSDGNILYEYNEKEEEVLNSNYVYILNEMLSNTTNKSFIDYTKPTALIIKDKLKEKYAIKTGSTNTDFWTVGYNKNKLMLVWTGNDDGSDVSITKSSYAKNIFADTIDSLNYNNSSESWYETPDDVVAIPLDAISGKNTTESSKTVLFYFLKGSEIIEKKSD